MTRKAPVPGDVIVGVVGAVVGIVFLVGVFRIPDDAMAFAVLGPRAAPMVISIAMIVCSLALVVRGFFFASRSGTSPDSLTGGAERSDFDDTDGRSAIEEISDEELAPWAHQERLGMRALVTVVLVGLYIAVFIPVGYLLSTFVFLAALTTYAEPRKAVRNLVFAAAFSLIVYYLFDRGLQVQLPPGVLG